MSPASVRRPELHAHAARIAQVVCAQYGAIFPGELRQVLSYWLSSEIAFERASQNLIAYAAALGITDPGDRK